MFKHIKLFLISILHYFRHHKSYSQDGEDVVLAAFFAHLKNYRGFYVDVGANHPVRFSNTCMYYRKGWRGINIDPTPGSMNPFKWWRKRDINLEIGIGATPSSMTFYCFNEPALNTFNAEVAARIGKPYKITKEVQVNIVPLRDVLTQHLPVNTPIDFMSIDVEGFEIEVLTSNDWSKFSPAYILVEDHGFSIDRSEPTEIQRLLNGVGYRIVAVLKRTIIYQKIPT